MAGGILDRFIGQLTAAINRDLFFVHVGHMPCDNTSLPDTLRGED